LQESWDEYASLLKKNKNPALQSFVLAKLNITSDSSFEVVTNNNLEHKFIEQEKRLLSEHLQKAFANKVLNFTVTITENPADFVPPEKTLSKKDQFLIMAEQYPMIRELKDKLKLDLDY
jgi:DNA polymerase III subunit gamma/tau